MSTRGPQSLRRLKRLSQVQLASPHISRDDVQALAAALPALQSARWYDHRGFDDVSDVTVSERDDFRREGTREERIKLDRLEGGPSPELNVGEWINAGDGGITTEQLRGKVLLVNFFTGWNIRPDIDRLHKLEQLHEKYEKQGLVILGVHSTDRADTLADFVAPHKFPWPVAADAANGTASAWSVTAYPSYYLIDRSGKLRFARIYRGDLERAVKELLAEK